MRVFRGFDELPKFRNAVVTLGSFDGVHRGHLSLLDLVCQVAQTSGGESVVLTFESHPRVVLGRIDGLRLLTSLEEKIQILEQLGIDNLIVIPFDKAFSRLSYGEFVREYLVERVGVKTLVVGYNHHFGRGNEGNYSAIIKLSEEFGFEICRVDEWRDERCESVSSTVVRRVVEGGDVERAAKLLSRNYLVVGQADGEGRVWVDDPLKMIPAQGVYEVLINGKCGNVEIDSNSVITSIVESEALNIEFLRRLCI